MVQPRGWCKAVTVSLTAVWRAHYDLACAVFLTSPPLAPVLVIIASLINAFLLPLCYSFSAIGLLRVEFFFFYYYYYYLFLSLYSDGTETSLLKDLTVRYEKEQPISLVNPLLVYHVVVAELMWPF